MGKNDKTTLGRALVKHHNHMIQEGKDKNKFYRTQNHQRVLESVTDVTDIDAVIERAEEAGRFFSYDHPAPTLPINLDTSSCFSDLTLDEHKKQHEKEEALHASSLRVPRRPPWKAEMTVEELDKNEKEAFLVWRRNLASLEANEMLVLTPFEKNLDIWRQLWRVVEKSDLLVMVIDARDPLFYRCPDVEAYAREIDSNKRTLLLVNKADLVPLSVRERWAKYFHQHDIHFAFWSAKAAAFASPLEEENHDSIQSSLDTKIYGREDLLFRLQSAAEQIVSMSANSSEFRRNSVVGFVGYPNVGKSSTINTLVGKKRTGVTSTPGKTKHFQTLVIEGTRLTLCDCPGLVFPSFSSSRYEMIASGVLPIDRMTKHREAVQIVADRVPRHVLESAYNISLPKPRIYEPASRAPSAAELLKAYCGSRGYVSSSGLPDETRAARRILKDFIEGKVLHFKEPPGTEVSGSGVPFFEKGDLRRVIEDMGMLESVVTDGGVKCLERKEVGAPHKRHMKNARKKDRSWRVGNGGGYGMCVVRGFHNTDPVQV